MGSSSSKPWPCACSIRRRCVGRRCSSSRSSAQVMQLYAQACFFLLSTRVSGNRQSDFVLNRSDQITPVPLVEMLAQQQSALWDSAISGSCGLRQIISTIFQLAAIPRAHLLAAQQVLLQYVRAELSCHQERDALAPSTALGNRRRAPMRATPLFRLNSARHIFPLPLPGQH